MSSATVIYREIPREKIFFNFRLSKFNKNNSFSRFYGFRIWIKDFKKQLFVGGSKGNLFLSYFI